MPTTCGFPNCKFRSRYRGQEDNRHFYRIPKRPLVLRQRWLKAIGRTEETVVSQLRICSAHFQGGEKKEGDIPVPDPQLDTPLSIPLPPKESKTGDRRRQQKAFRNHTGSSSSSSEFNGEQLRRNNFGSFHQNDLANIYNSNAAAAFPPDFLNHLGAIKEEDPRAVEAAFKEAGKRLQDQLAVFPAFSSMMNVNRTPSKPLIALLDGRDCSVEMPLLKDICTVAFCDAQATSEIHEKVLNEAVAAFMWNTIKLEKADLQKFRALKVLICLNSDTGNVNVDAASELGIAVCNTPGVCLDEVADSTISMILNLYRKTHFIAKMVEGGKTVTTIDQVREQFTHGSRRIRDSTLGIVGLGQGGSAVVQRAKAFGFNIIVYDPFAVAGCEKIYGVERCETLEQLLRRSDCVSLHCSYTPETRHLLNEETLQQLKPNAFVVNTSRPELIHETALAAALRSGHVKAAAVDVLNFGDGSALQLRLTGQLIQTAGTSWLSDESANELRTTAAKELRKALTGNIPQDLRFCVNKDRIMSKNSLANIPTSVPMNAPFNALGNNNLTDQYNGMTLPTSFGYGNPLLMNNILLSHAFGGFSGPTSNTVMPFGSLTGQSPKSSNGNRKRSRTTTPLNASASNVQSTSASPVAGNSNLQNDFGDKNKNSSESSPESNGPIEEADIPEAAHLPFNHAVKHEDTLLNDVKMEDIPSKKLKIEKSELNQGSDVNDEND